MSTPPRLPSFQNDHILDGVARRVTADINQLFSRERLERAAMRDERVRLARELHDGLLQSLTAAALQLKALSRVVGKNPHRMGERLRDLEQMIADEQRDLRSWIDALKPAASASAASTADLVTAVEKLCRRAESQWAMRVRFVASAQGNVPRLLGDAIYRLVQEALSNVGRHASARTARVSMHASLSRVLLVVADDGRGFGFRGRYDLTALNAQHIGPASLKDRIASLGGDLVVTSSPSGAQLEMTVPLSPGRSSPAAIGLRGT